MTEAYAKYRRSQVAELADWHEGFDMERVSISAADKDAGSPKLGDKIARNPANHDDKWLVAADYFAVNFEPVTVSEKVEESCPLCKGTGEVDRTSFVDSSKTIKNSCSQCHGSGKLISVSEKGEADDVLRGIRLKVASLHDKTLSDEYRTALRNEVLERIDSYLSRGRVCEHGQGLTDYCQPCGRVNGGG